VEVERSREETKLIFLQILSPDELTDVARVALNANVATSLAGVALGDSIATVIKRCQHIPPYVATSIILSNAAYSNIMGQLKTDFKRSCFCCALISQISFK